MSVCVKFQLSSWSRSGWKVCGDGVGWSGVVKHVTTMSNSNASCFELSCVSLCFDNITYLSRSGIFLNILRCSFQYNSICELVVNFLSGTELAEKSGNNETYCFVIANKSFGA